MNKTLHITNLSPAKSAEVQVINQTGQVMKRAIVKGSKGHLTFNRLKPGLYVVQIQDGQEVLRRKVIKE